MVPNIALPSKKLNFGRPSSMPHRRKKRKSNPLLFFPSTATASVMLYLRASQTLRWILIKHQPSPSNTLNKKEKTSRPNSPLEYRTLNRALRLTIFSVAAASETISAAGSVLGVQLIGPITMIAPMGSLHLGAPAAVDAAPTTAEISIMALATGQGSAGALLQVEAGFGLGHVDVRLWGGDDSSGEEESKREDRDLHDGLDVWGWFWFSDCEPGERESDRCQKQQ